MKAVIVTVIIVSLLHAGELTLKISGVKADRGGDLLVFLYENDNWLKVDNPHISVDVSEGETDYSVIIGDMKNMNYAVRVVHDENGDGKLTMRAFPPAPVEGYGFSSGYKPGGIPKYDKAEFLFSGDSEMSIEMTYP